MDLPKRLFLFWYPQAFNFFVRLLRNTIAFLEEDLAVGLMFKLLFTPLFHDATPTGRMLSFFFRLVRILFGLLAFFFAALFVAALVLFWFLSPVLIFIPAFYSFNFLFYFMVIFGLALFVEHIFSAPPKKLWQIKAVNQIWEATKLKKEKIGWASLIASEEVTKLLDSLELKPANFTSQNIVLSDEVLQKAIDLGRKAEARYLTEGFFWVAMLLDLPAVETALLKLNLKPDDFEKALNLMQAKKNKWRMIPLWDEDFAVRHLKGTNRGWLSAPTPNLDEAAEDLTRLAATRGFPDFVGRSSVVSEVINILSNQKGQNVMLVGEPGSGRSALVNYLAQKIIAGDAPESLATKRLVSLDLTKLLADVTTEGDLAKKIKDIFDEVTFVKDIIIYVDEIQNMGVGEASSNYNLFSLLLPFIESNEFQFIASTESASYTQIIEKNGSFSRLFYKVEVPPATSDETIQIIQNRSIDLARYQKITVTFVAIKQLVELSAKFIHDRVLPDSALAILNECQTVAKNGQITKSVVDEVFAKRVNVPIAEVETNQKQALLNLEETIHQKMIDQEEAVRAVSDALRRASTDLRDTKRPIGSFLFVGPTGVGKTELAKILSEVYFKNQGAFLQFDMSEYQTTEAVSRLLGSVDNPGELTEAVRNKPYALLLLDEFEKANPQILTLFLQVLEEGRLTDFSGRHIDFTNTIIIATSNAASLTIAQGLGSGQTVANLSPKVKDELLKVYKPELLNRFDKVVIFKPLLQQDLQKIVLLKLKSLQDLLKDKGYLVEFDTAVVAELTKRGYDPVLGARPLRRLIQDTLESRLSRLILENKLQKGVQFRADASLVA